MGRPEPDEEWTALQRQAQADPWRTYVSRRPEATLKALRSLPLKRPKCAELSPPERLRLVAMLAERMPRQLRRQRARAMLTGWARTMGLADAPCPACSGTGWADKTTLLLCPVCAGFRELPVGVALWVQAGMDRGRVPRRERFYPPARAPRTLRLDSPQGAQPDEDSEL